MRYWDYEADHVAMNEDEEREVEELVSRSKSMGFTRSAQMSRYNRVSLDKQRSRARVAGFESYKQREFAILA